MNRRTTILLAGFLTAGVITGIVSFTYNASANSAGVALDTSSATIEGAAIERPAINGMAESIATVDLAAVYQEREAALQARVAEGAKAIETLDATMQPQINDLNAEILIVTSRANEKAQNALALQESTAQLQAQIEREGQTFQQQVVALQARDSQTRTQLDAALGELQAAYALLATRQASMASSSGSSNGGDSSSNNTSYEDEDDDEDEGDENNDDEHDGEEHHEDEEHESHEEEHGDD